MQAPPLLSLRDGAEIVGLRLAVERALLVFFPPTVFLELEGARNISLLDRCAEYHVFALQMKTSHSPSLPAPGENLKLLYSTLRDTNTNLILPKALTDLDIKNYI